MTPASLAAKGLLAAYAARHGGAVAPTAGITLAMGWTFVEGAWTWPYTGTNNYGSVHATRGFASKHAADDGFGMVAFLDVGITRMRVYPTLVSGAGDYLDFVENAVSLATVATPTDFATGLYLAGYYGGRHPQPGEPDRTPLSQRKAAAAAGTLNATDQANIADGVAASTGTLALAQAAIASADSETGDPTARSVGPPFAPLADRLWPNGKHHELADSVAHIGAAARNPQRGYLSVDDCLNAPGGDGVWMFGASASSQGVPAPRQLVTLAQEQNAARRAALVGAVLGGVSAIALAATSRMPMRRVAA